MVDTELLYNQMFETFYSECLQAISYPRGVTKQIIIVLNESLNEDQNQQLEATIQQLVRRIHRILTIADWKVDIIPKGLFDRELIFFFSLEF